MFTGIITDIGEIEQVDVQKTGKKFTILNSFDYETIDIGASIACSGVCLTVTEKEQGFFAAEASPETLNVTSAGKWSKGTKLNLERALKAGDELGGHIVSGHVDAVGSIAEIIADGEHHILNINMPKNISQFIAKKGSLTIDGISLTVNAVDDGANICSLTIIPHTWENTNLQFLDEGSKVNLEVDMLARYTARLLETMDNN